MEEHHAYNRSALAKGRVLQRTTSLLSKLLSRSVFPAHVGVVTVLSAIGGGSLHGVARRPRLSQSTYDVVRAWQQYLLDVPSIENLYAASGLAWAVGFQPTSAYPDGWQAVAVPAAPPVRTRSSFVPSPGQAPMSVPSDAVRANGKTYVCMACSKPRCSVCRNRRLDVNVCCSAHHGAGDGLVPAIVFCSAHRLTRCGDCEQSRRSPAFCCKRHHRSRPGGSSAVT